MSTKARYATAHWLRFPEITTPDQLPLSLQPANALSWKIGPCGPVGPNGFRLPSEIWCAVGLFREHADAAQALATKESFLPFLANTTESWHQLLLPFRHHGECNHLNRELPGEIFEVSATDPGGQLMVITTAGFNFGPAFDMNRVIHFRRNVDVVNAVFQSTPTCLANQSFTPHTVGDDGYTFSVWRDDAAMLDASYRAGEHRVQMDRHKSAAVFDRSSFTRMRILASTGQWLSHNPLAPQ